MKYANIYSHLRENCKTDVPLSIRIEYDQNTQILTVTSKYAGKPRRELSAYYPAQTIRMIEILSEKVWRIYGIKGVKIITDYTYLKGKQ